MPRPRLYVGNIPFTITESEIRAHFDGFKLTDVRIITDRETGRSRGFGFVEVESVTEQKAAVERFNQTKLGDRTIIVSEAKEREPRRSDNDRRDARR
jgi:RNA recognition motif-containing protein